MRTKFFVLVHLSALVLATFTFASPREACGQVVHVVIATDDLDPDIGPAVRQDGTNIQAVFFTGITPDKLNIVRIPAAELDQDSILAALDAPNGRRVQTNDSLVFFFSGHGGNDQGPGPYLAIPRLRRSIPRDVIERAVRQAGARLGVLLTDCCNSLSPIEPGELFPTPGGALFIAPIMQSLFFEYTGFVDITSSKRGEISMCRKNTLKGSIFTGQLVEFLQKNHSNSMTWKKLVTRVRTGVADEFERDVKVVRFNDPDGSEVVQRTQTVTALALELQRANSEIGDGNPRRFGAFIQENGGDGVIIQSITAGSPASRIFIKELDVHGYMIPGDVILEANGRPIRSVQDFLAAVRASGDTLEGRVRDPRDGRISTFVADLSQGQ